MTDRQDDIDALAYPPASHDLAARLRGCIAAWEAQAGSEIETTDRNWRIAEALHLVTWLRPHTHAPLSLLQDEERAKLASTGLIAP